MPQPVIERAMRLLPQVNFVNAYGLTETSSTIGRSFLQGGHVFPKNLTTTGPEAFLTSESKVAAFSVTT